MVLNLKNQPQNQVMLQHLLGQLIAVAPAEDGRSGQALELNDLYTSGYAAAVLDLLAALGAIRLAGNRATLRVTSVQARYLLLLLRDLLNTDTPLVVDWQREGLTPLENLRHPFDSAVDLLSALDRRRLELFPYADPVRDSTVAIGLLLALSDEGRSYLMVYDPAVGAWRLPCGRFDLYDSSPNATLLRKFSEELGLEILGELRNLSLSELCPPLTDFGMSPLYGVLTRTTFHIYRVRLHLNLPLDMPNLRWISEAEALAGCTRDGQSVNPEPLPQLLALHSTTLDTLLHDLDSAPALLFPNHSCTSV